MVAFYNVEAEIYAKAKQQAKHVANDLNEDNNDDNEDISEDRGPGEKNRYFELDEGIDLTSPFLRNMVSDRPVPGLTGLVTPIITTDLEMNRAATAEEWDNM